MQNKFVITILVVLGLFFSACSNGIENLADNSVKDEAAILINLGVKTFDGNNSQSNARTVMAKVDDNKDAATLKNISIYAKLSTSYETLGSPKTLLTTWSSYSEMCKSPYSETISSGKYDFLLKAENYGATMLQALSGVNISAGTTTTLNFTQLEVSAEGAQTGGIEVKLEYRSGYGTLNEDFRKYVYPASRPYPIISIAIDSNLIATKDSSTYSVSKTTDEEGNTYEIYGDGITFVSAPVDSGFHIVQFTFTANDGSVLEYPVPVYVEAGYLSKETLYPFYTTSVVKNHDANSFTITYNSNSTTSATATQTFYEGSSIADAQTFGFSSGDTKRFKLWNTKQDGTGISYKAGDTPSISSDIILYAQWGNFIKVSYVINLDDKTDTFIQCYENTSALLSSERTFQDFDSSRYKFCGWDTKSDGSGKRYDINENPVLNEDIVLYAQWCGINSWIGEYDYIVHNANEWNAIMGAPFANTVEGEITASIGIQRSFSNPALALTKDKTFNGLITSQEMSTSTTISGLSGYLFDKIAEGTEVSYLTVKAPLCRNNYGTIKNVIVSGFSLTGNSVDDSLGAVCNRNYGIINNCSVNSCSIDGITKNKTYTGGICGYNEGKILGSGTVNLNSLSGNEYYGYVTGYNKTNAVNENSTSNPISSNITVKNLEGSVVLNKTDDILSNGYQRTYESFTIDRCAKVYFLLKDSSGGSNTNKETLQLLNSNGVVVKTFVNSGTPNIDTYIYLNKGTYKLKRINNNITYDSHMNLKIVTY